MALHNVLFFLALIKVYLSAIFPQKRFRSHAVFFLSLLPSTYPMSDKFSKTHFPYYVFKKFRIFLSDSKYKFPSLFPQASSSEMKLPSIHRHIGEPIIRNSSSLFSLLVTKLSCYLFAISVLHFTFSVKTHSRYLNIYSYLIWYLQFVAGLSLLLNFAFANVTRQ